MSEPFAQYPYGPYPVPEPPRQRGRRALGLAATAVLGLAAGAGARVALVHVRSPSGGPAATSKTTQSSLGQPITASGESSGTTEHLTGMIEANADIQEGDSGGPLVNAYGQVTGMDTAASSGSPGPG